MCKVAILLSIQSVRCSRGATFMAFADYLRSSIRLAALARLPVIYIFTHDSVRKDSHEPRLFLRDSFKSMAVQPHFD